MTYIKTELTKEIVIDSIITIHYFEYMRDFVFQGERHDFWEFLFVDKGTVSVQSDSEWLTLNSGDIIFHRPNEFHAIRSIGKNSPNLVAISFTSRSSAIKFYERKYCTLNEEERLYISLIIKEAEDAFKTPIHIPSIEQVIIDDSAEFAAQQLIILYLELFLINMRRNHSNSMTKASIAPKEILDIYSKNNDTLSKITQYMQFHICEKLTVNQICSAFSISKTSLHALFHNAYKCGAIDFFNQMKIQRSKEIMRNGTMNITDIAYFLSYSSLSYYSKQFKKSTGMSPHEYSSSIKGISESLKPH